MIKYIALTFFAFNLVACNTVNPVWDTVKAATGWGEGRNAPLQPGVEYLKVNVNGHQVMMALGYRIFPNPSGARDAVADRDLLVKNPKLYSPDESVHEFWYSGQKEMMELVDGRIVSTMGMTTEWRQSSTKAPSWESVDSSRTPVYWSRTRDLMPGYRYGFRDEVLTTHIDAPKHIKDVAPGATWYQDSINSKDVEGEKWVYSQTFARLNNRIVYSEQCISTQLCLSMKYVGMISK